MIKKIILFIAVLMSAVINRCYASSDTPLICQELSQINQLFHQAERQQEEKNYAKSIQLFDRGIEQIGDRYLSDKVSDDTDTKLILSKLVQKEGKLSQAAHLRRGVLSSRLSLLKEDNLFCQP